MNDYYLPLWVYLIILGEQFYINEKHCNAPSRTTHFLQDSLYYSPLRSRPRVYHCRNDGGTVGVFNVRQNRWHSRHGMLHHVGTQPDANWCISWKTHCASIPRCNAAASYFRNWIEPITNNGMSGPRSILFSAR